MISELLYRANSDPPRGMRTDFYNLKERILESKGTVIGNDVQHIEGLSCWGCSGTGSLEWIDDEYEVTCDRCFGTGWYRMPKWIVLEKFEFGGHSFHIPREHTTKKPDPDVTNIRGKIKHRHHKHAEESFAILCIVTGNFRLFFKWLRYPYGRLSGWHPLMVLRSLVVTMYNVRHRVESLRLPSWKRPVEHGDDIPF